MSYDEALQQLREQAVEPPRFTEVEQRRRWWADRKLPRPRALMAVTANLVAIAGFAFLTLRPVFEHDNVVAPGLVWWRASLATLLPLALLLWSLRLMRRTDVGAQMLIRAVLWSNVVVGALVAANFMLEVERVVGAGIAVACATALLALGSRGLDEAAPGDVFAPNRFRGKLLLALVMASADALTLLFSGAMQLRIGMEGWNLLDTIDYAGPTMLAAAVMALAVWGLYRLRTWALFLNLAANIAIAYFALEGALNLAGSVAIALTATAGVQMFLPVPILALALGDRKAGRPLLRGHAPKLLPVSVVLIAGLAVELAAVVEDPGGWLTGPGRAFFRGLARERGAPGLSHAGRDWSGRNFEGRKFDGVDMREIDLHGASGIKALRNSDLTGADLREVQFRGITFGASKLVDADLRDANLEGARVWASLVGADLRGARLRFADLRGATIARADFRGADLFGARLGSLHETAAFEGATCPDGFVATADTDCRDHLGTVSLDDARYRGRFEVGRGGQVTAIVPDEYLHFGTRVLLKVAEDEFVVVEPQRLAGRRLVFERNGDEVTVRYENAPNEFVTLIPLD